MPSQGVGWLASTLPACKPAQTPNTRMARIIAYEKYRNLLPSSVDPKPMASRMQSTDTDVAGMCRALRHVSSPASRTLRVAAERNTPPTAPMVAYPTSIAPVMRPARLRLADAQTPTPKAVTSTPYGMPSTTNTRGLVEVPGASSSLND